MVPARALITATALVAASGISACGSTDGGTASAPDSVTTLAVTRVEPSAGTTDGSSTPSTNDTTITMAFAGDVHFEEEVEPYLGEPAGLGSAGAMLSAADLAVVNLETAITERGAPEPKEYHFRAPATALGALQEAGVDLVSMANNHAVDFGTDGLTDTLAAKAGSQIPVIGIGHDADEAFAPYTSTIKGRTVAVLAATQVPDWTAAHWAAASSRPGVASAREPGRLIDAVETANQRADIVVVFLHWGTERVGCLPPSSAHSHRRSLMPVPTSSWVRMRMCCSAQAGSTAPLSTMASATSSGTARTPSARRSQACSRSR